MKMYNKGLLAAAVASAMFSMTSIAAADCPVKVGVAYPTSVDWGKPIAETALWVAELMNEAGGVDGCQGETILHDSTLPAAGSGRSSWGFSTCAAAARFRKWLNKE